MKKIFLVTFLLILFLTVGFSQACIFSSEKSKDPVITIGDVSLDVSEVKPVNPPVYPLPCPLFSVFQGKPEKITCNFICEKPREGDENNKPTPIIPYWFNGVENHTYNCVEHACNHTCNCVCPLCLNNMSGKPLVDENEGVNYNGYTGINFNDGTGLWPNVRGYDLVYKWPTYNSGSILIDNYITYRLDSDLPGTLSTPKRGYDLVLKYPIYSIPVLETLTDKVIV